MEQRWTRRLLPWLVLAPAGALSLRRLYDTDTWWHLASGRWIVEHASVPAVDTLSYTVPGKAWINLQWLGDVLLYGIFRAAGSDGWFWWQRCASWRQRPC